MGAVLLPETLWAEVHRAAAGEPWPPASAASADLLLAQAAREGLLPLLFAQPALPPAVRAALERQRGWLRVFEARAQILGAALQQVTDILGGEPFVVLKGADYGRRLYARPALRPMQDLDLLVPARRIDAVCQRLLAAGLRRRPPARAARAASSYYERALLLGDVIVEVHQAFLHRSRHPVDYDALWSRRVAVPDLGPHAARLHDVDAVAYHALAMAKDEFSVALVRFVDLRLMLQADEGLLAQAVRRAAEWSAARAMYGALHQLARVFPDMAGQLRPAALHMLPARTRRFLERWVLPAPSEHARPGSVTRARQLWRKLWLLDGPRRRAAFAADHLRATAQGWWSFRA